MNRRHFFGGAFLLVGSAALPGWAWEYLPRSVERYEISTYTGDFDLFLAHTQEVYAGLLAKNILDPNPVWAVMIHGPGGSGGSGRTTQSDAP